MYSVALVDDEQRDVARITHCLSRFEKEKQQRFKVASFQNGINFLTAFKSNYDIVFMDVNLPHMNGIDVAKKMRALDRNIVLVFVTNMVGMAIKGYSVGASSFVPKPIEYDNISDALQQIIPEIEEKKLKQTVLISSNRDIYKVNVDDIAYVEVLGHRLVYHIKGGQIQSWGTMKTIESTLPQQSFARCNACYLVNLQHVSMVKNMAVHIGDDRLPISQSKRKDFIQRLTSYSN